MSAMPILDALSVNVEIFVYLCSKIRHSTYYGGRARRKTVEPPSFMIVF